MGLDVSKLQNVKKASDGKIIARCPACEAAGADSKGEHLVIFPDGKYGCVANPEDKAHSKEIFKLAGQMNAEHIPAKISVVPFKVPDSTVIMDLGRFERFSASGVRRKAHPLATPIPEADGQPASTAPIEQKIIPVEVEKNEAHLTVTLDDPPGKAWGSADASKGTTKDDIMAFLAA